MHDLRGLAYAIGKEDRDRAIADFTQTIRLDPDDAYAYSNRGVAYEKKEMFDRAIEDYNQAIRINPNYANAYINRGRLMYWQKGMFDQAIEGLNHAIRLDPNSAEAYNVRGEIYNKKYFQYNKGYTREERRDALMRSKADFEKTLELDPNYAPVQENLKDWGQ
ncbi:MAG: tetratricopeptide repeat protein [Treponema sp.]|jgi:tetratricopeptide (TPR) repeat protein|nr:tetratricopeptide repeat protein [Treponema sp.]